MFAQALNCLTYISLKKLSVVYESFRYIILLYMYTLFCVFYLLEFDNIEAFYHMSF